MLEIENPKSEFEPLMDNHQTKEGMKAALPIVLGYLPVGVAFGVLARKAGLTPLETGLMSFLVYAGASQFIAVEMISNGIFLVPIVLTTLFINLRHLLMSSTVSLYFTHPSLRMMGLLSAQLTDESFAVAMADPSKISNRPRYLVALQMTSQLAWISGSVAGALFGSFINSSSYGIPFALPALFICLLVLQLRSRIHFWVMCLAGVFSLFFKELLPGNWYMIGAALVASIVGLFIELNERKRKNGV
jgi:4-azaleucine resistance transporter AzlC